MRISVYELKEIWKDAEFYRVDEKDNFKNFDIVFIGEKSKETDRVLFFATYARNIKKRALVGNQVAILSSFRSIFIQLAYSGKLTFASSRGDFPLRFGNLLDLISWNR